MTISIQSAVDSLIEVHAGSNPLVPLSATHGDFTRDHAYTIQDALRAELARRRRKPIAWQLGAASPSG